MDDQGKESVITVIVEGEHIITYHYYHHLAYFEVVAHIKKDHLRLFATEALLRVASSELSGKHRMKMLEVWAYVADQCAKLEKKLLGEEELPF